MKQKSCENLFLIEFAGPLSAGKSTLAEEAKRYLNKKGLRTLDKEDVFEIALNNQFGKKDRQNKKTFMIKVLKYIFPRIFSRDLTRIREGSFRIELLSRFKLINPDFVRKNFNIIRRSNLTEKEKTKFLSSFQNTFSHYQSIIENIEKGVVIFEDGFLQSYLLRPDIHKVKKRDLREYAQDISNKIDCVFFIDTISQIAYRRAKKRGTPQKLIVSKEKGEVLKQFDSMKRSFEEMKDVFEVKGVKTITIDNSKDYKDSKKELHNRLDELSLMLKSKISKK